MEHTVTGIISEICDDSGVVSFVVSGIPRSFCFSKKIFHSFGMFCEGRLTNILDVGMEVNLSYRISYPTQKLCVVAVWIGSKPEEDGSVRAVYNQMGRVSRYVDDEDFLVENDEISVLANKRMMYRDGCLVEGRVDLDEEVQFDAIPFERKHPSGALYEAVCTWVGKQPRLVDRFGLQSTVDSPDAGLDCLESLELHGQVVVIPNDVVALVEVEYNAVLFEVMLFRESFGVACNRIQDVVDVGDGVYMRIRSHYMFSGCKQWIAVNAWKSDFEVSVISEVSSSAISSSVNQLPKGFSTVQLVSMILIGWALQAATFLIVFFEKAFSKKITISALGFGQTEVSLDMNAVARKVSSEVKKAGSCVRSTEKIVSGAGSVQEQNNGEIVTSDQGALFEECPGHEVSPEFEESTQVFSGDDSVRKVSLRVEEAFSKVDRGQEVHLSIEESPKIVLSVNDSVQDRDCEIIAESADLSENVSGRKGNLDKMASAETDLSHVESEVNSSISKLPEEGCKKSKCNSNSSGALKTKQLANVKNDVGKLRNQKVLYKIPPLLGDITVLADDCGIITYNKIFKIFVNRDDFFVEGKRESLKKFLSGCNRRVVSFEAVLTDQEKSGCQHVATCVWSGTKPLVMVAAPDMLRPRNLALLQEKDGVFYGYVAKLCLPSFAVVMIPGEDASVGVHTSSFVTPKCSGSVHTNSLITDRVSLNDVVKFKVKGVTALRGYEVETTTFTKETWEKNNAGVFLCQELDRIRQALTV